METVRTFREVEARLRELYGNQLAGPLFSTWVKLATIGEEQVFRAVKNRTGMSRRTFYRHRSQLTLAGCSWFQSDVVLKEAPSYIPLGFSPVRADPRRLCEVSLTVDEQLRPYALAA